MNFTTSPSFSAAPLNSPRIDGRQTALDNELLVLKALKSFGHLRRPELAAAVWPHSPSRSGYLMALRTVKRLLAKSWILERTNNLGTSSLILGTKGVARLAVEGISATEGYDLSSVGGPQFQHRTTGTCFLLERAKKGHTVFSEYAIGRNEAPVTAANFKSVYRKVPDGVVIVPGVERGYIEGLQAADWIEVENSFKDETELLKIIRFALWLGEPMRGCEGVIWDQVVFVYNSKQGHESRIMRVLRSFLAANPEFNTEEALTHLILARADIGFPLVWNGVEEVSAWSLL